MGASTRRACGRRATASGACRARAYAGSGTVSRAVPPLRDVELDVRVDSGKLAVEATGLWPILDFEKGRPVPLRALSDHEFYVEAGDHTRIDFLRDSAGKVSGAVLNPGPSEQKGQRME